VIFCFGSVIDTTQACYVHQGDLLGNQLIHSYYVYCCTLHLFAVFDQ